jgi:hypothetical protein
MNGASRGPEKTVMEKTVIARPRVLLSNMSEKTAPTTARGEAPKKPPQNRHMRTVCRSFPAATAIWKIEKPNIDKTMGSLRPRNSERGAHNVGPVAKPSTYKDRPRRPTSVETSNCLETATVADEKILEANAATRVV